MEITYPIQFVDEAYADYEPTRNKKGFRPAQENLATGKVFNVVDFKEYAQDKIAYQTLYTCLKPLRSISTSCAVLYG
jgi:hypothetical protein